MFFVKSAYHLEHSRNIMMKGETLTLANTEDGWKKVRDLNVEGKVKQFLWKAGQEILPTKLSLFKKNITDTSLCPICEKEVESSVHAL